MLGLVRGPLVDAEEMVERDGAINGMADAGGNGEASAGVPCHEVTLVLPGAVEVRVGADEMGISQGGDDGLAGGFGNVDEIDSVVVFFE